MTSAGSVRALDFLFVDGTENDGNSWKDLVAKLESKIQPRGKTRNDQMDFPPRVFPLQEFGLKLLVIAIRRARDIEVFVVNLDAAGGSSSEGGSNTLIDQGVPRTAVAVIRIKHDNHPGIVGIRCCNFGTEEQYGRQDEQLCQPKTLRSRVPSPCGDSHGFGSCAEQGGPVLSASISYGVPGPTDHALAAFNRARALENWLSAISGLARRLDQVAPQRPLSQKLSVLRWANQQEWRRV